MNLINGCYRCTNDTIPTNLIVKELVFNYLGSLDADSFLTDSIIKMAKDASDKANQAADVVADLVVGKVRTQDVSTEDGSTQDVKNKELFQNQAAYPFEGSYNTIDSFELGATITQRNQALRHAEDGKLYRWAGDLPKDVPASSTPTSSGGMGDTAWLEVSDVTLRQDLASPDMGAAMVAYKNRTVAAKLDDIEVTPEDFGAVGDGVTDDSAAFVAMMNSRPELGGFSVKLGAKRYKLNSTALYFLRRIQISGVSRQVSILDFSDCTEVVNFPYNSHIIVVHSNNIAPTTRSLTPIEIPEGWVGSYGEMCGLSNLTVLCNSSVEDGNGVFFNVSAEVRNLTIVSANLHGAVICGSGGGLSTRGGTRGPVGGGIGGNSNNGIYTNMKASGCGGDGIHIAGSDANANLFLHADASNNGGWGIQDMSLLGNTYLQPHTAANKYGAYRVKPASTNRSCFLGAYTEGGQGSDNGGEIFEMSLRATFLGATGEVPRGDTPAMTNENAGFVFRRPVLTMDNPSSAGNGEAYALLGKGAMAIRTVDGKLLEIKRLDSVHTSLFHDGQSVMRFRNEARDAVKPNRPWFSNGFSLAVNHSQTANSAAPTTGDWYRGEIVWNTSPSVGGYVGWVCTSSGTPGTWHPFGIAGEDTDNLNVKTLNASEGFGVFDAVNVTSKPTVTGDLGDGTALKSLLTALESYGLIIDSTTDSTPDSTT